MTMYSMTGFGRGQLNFNGRSYALELRSFNNRFLDLKVRLPWMNGELEQRLQTYLRARLGRGRIELALREESGEQAISVRLNSSLARDLARIIKELTGICQCDQRTAASMLPQLRELVQTDYLQINLDDLWPALEPALSSALVQLSAMRQAEGAAIAADLLGHLKRLQALVAQIEALAQGEPSRQQQKLQERLQKLVGESQVIDPLRLAQEVALLADRADISEELARLQSHFSQMNLLIAGPDSSGGRRIEFLLQELNRELNTIGAKTASAQVAHLIVEGKSLAEKMREQIQNIE